MQSLQVLLFSSIFHTAVLATPVKQTDEAKRYIGQLPVPASSEAPKFRWWWPGGWIEADEIRSEIEEIAKAGFGGAEISDVQDSITVSMNASVYGWARERWNDGVLAAYEAGNELGVHVDYTLGPHWPTGVPGYTPDSPETSKELVHGQVLLSAGATFSGSLPLPVADPSGKTTGNPNVTATAELVAVLAARTNATSTNETTIAFEPSTLVDLTGHYNNGTLSWTAPTDGQYILVAVYGRGTGQIQNLYDGNPDAPKLTDPFPAYIVDHLSTAGVQASVKYWEEHILSDELRSLLQVSGGSLFEDSLELKLKQYWTSDFIQEFKSRRGYDLTPYLLYVLQDTNTFTGADEVSRQIQYDFYSTVTDLYLDYRVTGLKQFANSLGLKLRVQPYTATFDSSRGAALVDIPEGESLGFEGDSDAFRVLATGRDVAGHTSILSDELGAYMGKAYGVTWNFLLGTANLDYSLGVSQSVIHGWPYRDSPTSQWPGFAAFTPLGGTSNGFADAWGPRQPQWPFASNASIYMARSQALLQSGSSSVDLAILSTDWGVTATWSDTGLNDAGYSYQFPSPELFSKYSATVKNRRLIPGGPRYKALIMNNITYLNVDSVNAVLSYAKAGLPVVVVGDAPSQPQSFCESCTDEIFNINKAFDSVLSLKTTKQVTSESDVPAALKVLGVTPLIQYANPSNVSTTTIRRRVDEDGYIYWIYSSAPTSQTVLLEGTGYPYRLNRWTGEVTPIAAFDTQDGYTAINITLGENAAEAIYLGAKNGYGISNLSKHVTATDTEAVADEAGNIFLRSTENGTYTAKLSTGKTASVTFTSIPSPVTPSSWKLVVEDWAPTALNETGLNSSLTTKTTLPPINLATLAPWTNITGLEYASGIGTYTTTVNLSTANSSQSLGVYLNIGDVEGTWGVKINGVQVEGVDWFVSSPLDVTSYVKEITNVIEVTVATTLWNKLRKTWPSLYGTLEAQSIGLLGPVNLTYFAQEEI